MPKKESISLDEKGREKKLIGKHTRGTLAPIYGPHEDLTGQAAGK